METTDRRINKETVDTTMSEGQTSESMRRPYRGERRRKEESKACSNINVVYVLSTAWKLARINLSIPYSRVTCSVITRSTVYNDDLGMDFKREEWERIYKFQREKLILSTSL